MPNVFDNDVIRFQYPENWQVDRQETDEGWTISVQSPGTAFMLISCYVERPEVQEVLDASLSAMKQDYPELESEQTTNRVAGHSTKGYELTFLSLDTLNTCQINSFRSRTHTFLLLSQSSSFDTSMTLAVLEAIQTSMELRE